MRIRLVGIPPSTEESPLRGVGSKPCESMAHRVRNSSTGITPESRCVDCGFTLIGIQKAKEQEIANAVEKAFSSGLEITESNNAWFRSPEIPTLSEAAWLATDGRGRIGFCGLGIVEEGDA